MVKNRMLKHGDIIKINFDPTLGHEQAGYRLALVISNQAYYENTGFAILLLISNTNSEFPLHIPLEGTKTTGYVFCEHIKAVDLSVRKYSYVETLSQDQLKHVIKMVYAEMKILE